MSHKNPKVSEVIALNKHRPIAHHLSKSYLNLARSEFYYKHRKQATLYDASELVDLFEAKWGEYYMPEAINKRNIEHEHLFKLWVQSVQGPY